MGKEKEQVVKTIKVKGLRRRVEGIKGTSTVTNKVKGEFNYTGEYNGESTDWIFINIVETSLTSNNITITIEATRKDNLNTGRDITFVKLSGDNKDLSINYGSDYDGTNYTKWETPTPKGNGSFITKAYLESRLASLKKEE